MSAIVEIVEPNALADQEVYQLALMEIAHFNVMLDTQIVLLLLDVKLLPQTIL